VEGQILWRDCLSRRSSAEPTAPASARFDNRVHDQALLDRPSNADIQMELFYDYRTNLPLYPAVQAYFREHRPPTIIVWGKNDKIFRPTARIRTSATCSTLSFI
jgi:hypothetical protein